MKKIKNILFLTTFLLMFIVSPAFADIQIGEFVITDNSTAKEVIVYIFQILVAIGTLIAVTMVVMAGIEWMTSDGDPSKISGAKSKIKNALLGVGILLGSGVIINTINPEIAEIKVDDLRCDTGIIVTLEHEYDNGDPDLENRKAKTRKCIDQNMAKISDGDYEVIETINIGGWDFTPGSLLKVYAFSEENYKGHITNFDFSADGSSYSGNIPENTKSIYFLKRYQGVYLYDNTNYGIKNKLPLYTSTSISNLKNHGFEGSLSSIYFLNTLETKYSAVLFTSPEYKGGCGLVGVSSKTLNDGAFSPYYTEHFGNNRASSIIVTKSNPAAPVTGEVVFYTTPNCASGNLNDPTYQVKHCRIPISNEPKSNSIFSIHACGGTEEEKFQSGDNVMSFQINGNAGVVISTSDINAMNSETRCQYFERIQGCINLRFTEVYSHDLGGNKPKSFIIIPK